MVQTIPAENGIEAFLELLNAEGVEYIFLNPGTDTYPLQEAVAKFKALGKRTPEVVLCLHESVAVAAAHGYFMVSRRPQLVFVHADLGLQQVGGSLHNAQRGRAGIVLCSGRVPSSIDKSRLNQVHWLQEQFDQAGTVRNYVKWEYELRTTENIHHVVRRAFQVAASEPSGPVYLAVPQDVMLEKANPASLAPARQIRVSYPGLDERTLSEITSALLSAANPLILTGYTGRNRESVDALSDLAVSCGARVVSSPVRMNFPTTHPLFSGFDATPFVSQADVILILDQDVPYILSRVRPQPSARIIHIDIDPCKDNYPLWGFPVDMLIRADTAKVLPVLSERLLSSSSPAQKALIRSRYERIAAANEKMQAEWVNLAVTKSAQKPLAPDWVFHCLNEVIDENTLVLSEAVTNTAALLRNLKRSRPGTFFQSGGSNLGWGLGAALGASLASPGKTLVTVEGDGCFVFACPTAALWAAATYHIPFLCIILNNMQYTAPKLTIKMALGANSYSARSGNWVGTEIKPSPDYAAIARACQAYAERVEEPAALPSALKAALEQVKKGQPAVLEVMVAGTF